MARDTHAKDITKKWAVNITDAGATIPESFDEEDGWGPQYSQPTGNAHPEREIMNAQLRRLSALGIEINTHGGILEWDPGITYVHPASVFVGDQIYLSKSNAIANLNKSPNSETNFWVEYKPDWGATDGPTEILRKPTGIPSDFTNRLVPTGGSANQVLTQTSSGPSWSTATETGVTSITEGTGISVTNPTSASPTIGIDNGGVTSTQLANNSVTRDKIDATNGAQGRFLEYRTDGLIWSTVTSGGTGTVTGIDSGTGIRIDDGATATPEVNIANAGVGTTQLANASVTKQKLHTDTRPNWTESNSTDPTFVRNKPTTITEILTISDNAPANNSVGSNGDIWLEY